MSDSEFSNWDDFVETVEKMAENGIVELFVNEDGEESIKLTEKGQQMAEMIKVKELAKEEQGLKKYRRSENERAKWYHKRMN